MRQDIHAGFLYLYPPRLLRCTILTTDLCCQPDCDLRGKPFNMLFNLKLLPKTLKRLCGPVLSVLVLLAFGARIPFIVGLPCTLKDVHDTSSVNIPYPAMTVSECLQSSQGSGLSLRHLQPHQCGSRSQQTASAYDPGQPGRGLACFVVILLLRPSSETQALFILLMQWPLRESHHSPLSLPLQHVAQHFLTFVLNRLICHAALPRLA